VSYTVISEKQADWKYYCANRHFSTVTTWINNSLSSYATWSTSKTVATI